MFPKRLGKLINEYEATSGKQNITEATSGMQNITKDSCIK